MALYIGLMSGTSIDGVDAVLADLDAATQRPVGVRAHAYEAMPPTLAESLLALNASGDDEVHRCAQATHGLMRLYAQATASVLRDSSTPLEAVVAIGAHGQTIRHRPRAFHDGGYTLQLADGALLAELTGLTTVCDFRSADVAAGGQGAPLVPAFHAGCFAEPGHDLAVLNVGGIANLTLLHADGRVGGFDTGPGNLLMDAWYRRHAGLAYDDGGQSAARGTIDAPLLRALLSDPYFAAMPPKSTGRDEFHLRWIDQHLAQGSVPCVEDMLATLCELTARSAADALGRFMPRARKLWVCGGGAFNLHLLRRLGAALPGVRVDSTRVAGVPPDQVEGLAFAWLAACRLAHRPANLPTVTGARGPRILGAVHLPPPPSG